MKISIIALASLMAAGTAFAQSNVTLYGIVDTNLTYQKGADSLKSMGSGGMNGSRWGVRGTEDLGGGLKAMFQLESGFNSDVGTLAQGGRIFGRRSLVGLEGGFGSIKLGRTLTPTGVLADESATLGTKGADLQVAAAMLPATTLYRSDNAITYDSPNLGGLTASLQYSFDNDGAEETNRVGRQGGFNVIYKGGPLQLGAAYLRMKQSATGPDLKTMQGNAGWDFGVAAVKGIYVRDDYGTAEDRVLYGAEVSAPLGSFRASLGVGKLRNSTGAAGVGDDDATLYSVQVNYALSKRTFVYTYYTYVSDPGAATTPALTARPGYRVNAAGQASRQAQIGLRHAF